MKDKIYLIGFLIIVALPLLNKQPIFSPPDWGKTIVFRIVLSLLLFIFLWQVISGKREIKKYKSSLPVLYLLISLLGVYFLATIFSLDPLFSFWGSPYRSGGFLNFSFYIISAILAFLVLDEKKWQIVLKFTIFIASLVSLIAIFQWQGLFKNFIASVASRPFATLGNPIMLSLYLLLLVFLTLSYIIKENSFLRKTPYLLVLPILVFTIFLTYSRAIWIGLILGLTYFISFYPYKKKVISLFFKISLLVILILGISTVYYLNTYPFPKFIEDNETLKGAVSRLSIERVLKDSRFSSYKVSLQALKDRPILGYGPENFSIAFDKYYDPSLEGLEKTLKNPNNWWDRAHSFVFDIAVPAGLPALIIFLALFVVIFYQLQKIKKTENKLTAHTLQTTFLAYLVANFFSFDTFSIYLILFLLITYSLSLIKQGEFPDKIKKINLPLAYQNIIKGSLIFLLIYFIWFLNIKPTQINTRINTAEILAKNNYLEEAIGVMNQVLPKKSYLDNYLRLQYVNIVKQYIEEKNLIEIKPEIEKAITLLEDITKTQPYYARSWILLAQYNNILIDNWEEDREEEVRRALEKASELAPKRQEIFQELTKINILTRNYQEALNASKECLDLNEKLANCWWLVGISNIYLNEPEEANYYIETAKEMNYPIESKGSQLELAQAYIELEDYNHLVNTYLKLIELDPENPQHYASLAFVYKELKQTEEAKKITLKLIELFPAHKTIAEEFLKTL